MLSARLRYIYDWKRNVTQNIAEGVRGLFEFRHTKSTHVTFTGTKQVTFRVETDGHLPVGKTTRKGIPDGGNRLTASAVLVSRSTRGRDE